MLKLIPIAGAAIGCIAGALTDGNPWRGCFIGAVLGGVTLPVALWGLWVAFVRLSGFTVQ
jgi:hypothetical protein